MGRKFSVLGLYQASGREWNEKKIDRIYVQNAEVMEDGNRPDAGAIYLS